MTSVPTNELSSLLPSYSSSDPLLEIHDRKDRMERTPDWSLNTLIPIEDFCLKISRYRWHSPKSHRIILASRHVARRTITEKSATSVIRRQKGIIVLVGNNVPQVPGPVTSVSAHARTSVVLKIYNPVGAYCATGFKSRPPPARNRFNAFRENKTRDPGQTGRQGATSEPLNSWIVNADHYEGC